MNCAALTIQLLTAFSAPSSVAPQALGAEICLAAHAFGLSPTHLTQTVLLESKGVATARSAGGDIGLMQISPATAAAYRLTPQCLQSWQCNLWAGAQIMHDQMQSTHWRRCHYNVGSHRDGSNICLHYEAKLDKLNLTNLGGFYDK